MRLIDAQNIIRFNTRMGMFICPSNRANVVAFLHGYEYGTGHACRFTELLSRHIGDRHHIEPYALGWPHQIARLSEQRSLEWMDLYLLVSSEVLSAAIESVEPRCAPSTGGG